MEFPVFQFMSTAPTLFCHWAALAGPTILTCTLKMFMHIDKIPSQLCLLQAKQAQLYQPTS